MELFFLCIQFIVYFPIIIDCYLQYGGGVAYGLVGLTSCTNGVEVLRQSKVPQHANFQNNA